MTTHAALMSQCKQLTADEQAVENVLVAVDKFTRNKSKSFL